MLSSKNISIRLFLFVSACACAITSFAQALVDCPTYDSFRPRLPFNSTVAVIVQGAEPAGTSGVTATVVAGMNSILSAQSTGTTLAFRTSIPTDGTVYILVDYTRSTTDCAGDPVGCLFSYNANGIRTRATITLNMNKANCGPSYAEKCFDQTQPQYVEAVQGTLYHEFMHAAGLGHAPSGLMGYFDGTNNRYNPSNSPNICDQLELSRNLMPMLSGAGCL